MTAKQAAPLETKDLANQPAPRPPVARVLETSASGLSASFEGLNRAHHEYMQENNNRTHLLEKKAGVDVLLDEKLSRLDSEIDRHIRRLDELQIKAQRLERASSNAMAREHAPAVAEHKTAFHSYMRRGAEEPLRQMERKSMSAGSGQDGGYLVPSETETNLLQTMAAISPMRALSAQRQVSANTFKRPFSPDGAACGWVGETENRTQTAGPGLQEQVFATMELYAMPAATQTLLDDAAIDIDAWLTSEVESAFARQETEAFVNGDGSTSPTGFLAYAQAEENSWQWGKVGTRKTGVNGALPAQNPSDKLIDLIYTLKGRYRQNATFVLNRGTQAQLRKLKDADGNYIWQPPASIGASASLLGYPVQELEQMPDAGSGETPIAFGDFKQAYLIVDRLGLRVLRDPFSAKPYVLFYITKRVGGGILDFDALKLLKYSA
ncbi:phage major capsid protein [Polycladidibacter hongkongensis]|uniref:phage major capsid protein n=1 Tax=Polycladidibacter hongkongensis TaxID=1647556 RepID=UPI0009E879BC|nr:phage major capsid protein [Pseudovibrio hongkongensis]